MSVERVPSLENAIELEKPVVLVADNDSATRPVTCSFLRQFGFIVEEAEDGMQALAAFERTQPDVVLLNAKMPGMDGCEVCAELRKLRGGKNAAVLILVGLGDIESIHRAYEAGATDFITRPISSVTFGHRVRCAWRATRIQAELRRTVAAMPDLIFKIGRDGTILDFEGAKDFNLAIHPDSLVGRKIGETLFAEACHKATSFIEHVIETGQRQILEHQIQRGSNVYYYESHIVPNGEDELLVIVRDDTERKKDEQKITHLAYHDPLTGLLNRHSFKKHLGHALAQSDRHGLLAATLFLDLDRFKRVNDTLGHGTGDLILQQVAERLVQCTRKSDCRARFGDGQPTEAVARAGGDEFIILLPGIADAKDAAVVARRILNAVATPVILGSHEVFITASIGISIYPTHGEDVKTLLRNADKAMYLAKDEGRNNFQFYTTTTYTKAMKRMTFENDLRKALHRGELVLEYQPQVDIGTGEVAGVEALLRWHHPERGVVPPLEFIPLAEETGFILPIGRWVLRVACMQNVIWQKAGLKPIRVTVNLSGHQFRQKNLIEFVKKALNTSGLNPSYLELEITESTIMQNAASTIHTLGELKNMGLRLAIDDFGTGYSSLSYLKRFPLDVLKIDKSFIKDIPDSPDDAAIVKAIIAMAHTLNLKVIAEGVESARQLEFLRENRCDEMQGYFFSPPLPPASITKLLEEQKRLQEDQRLK